MELNTYAKLEADDILIWHDGPLTYFTKPIEDNIVFANAVIERWDDELGYESVLFVFSILNLSLYKQIREGSMSLRSALLDDSVTHLSGFPGESDGKIVGLLSKEELIEANWLPSEDIKNIFDNI